MSVLDLFLNTRKWYLRNEDTGDVLEGQFPPQNTTRNVTNNWSVRTSLNRGKAITQYLNSANDTVQFQAAFFAQNFLETGDVEEKLETLISWAKRDPQLRRPAIVTFWIGNGHLEQRSTIEGITNIAYGEPTITGALREVTFTMNLREFTEYTVGGDLELFETRYHRTRERDYYESLAQREYGRPLLGDVIRKRNPTKPNLAPGVIVPLPSIEALRTEKVEPKSVPLSTAYGRVDTPQRSLRMSMFDRRSGSYVSHIIV